MDQPTRSARSLIGLVLCRCIVPLWVLTGAVFKFVEATPTTLPSNILKVSDRLGLDLYTVLATLIALEVVAVAAMLFLGKHARSVAIFMLGCFAVLLVGEILSGQSSCGCMGAASPPPWVMLLIDGALLIAVLATGPIHRLASAARWPLAAAAIVAVAGSALSFGKLLVLDPGANPGPPPVNPGNPDGGNDPVVSDDPTVNPNPTALPRYWYVSDEDMAGWVGGPWRDVDIFDYMPRWPSGMDDEGRRHVIFYRRSCEHCEEMFYDDLVGTLAVPVTTIEVPESKTELRGSYAFRKPETECEELEPLPLGCDWIVTTPLIITVENGTVICVNMGDHVPCIEMP